MHYKIREKKIQQADLESTAEDAPFIENVKVIKRSSSLITSPPSLHPTVAPIYSPLTKTRALFRVMIMISSSHLRLIHSSLIIGPRGQLSGTCVNMRFFLHCHSVPFSQSKVQIRRLRTLRTHPVTMRKTGDKPVYSIVFVLGPVK
jgi:hypothetical protein